MHIAPRSRPRTLAAAVVSGLLFALAFPPLEWVLLLPLALVPWVVALAREESRGRALFSGFLFGLAYWCASIPWIVYVVTHYGGQGPVMGVVCLVILAAILAEWPALVGWGTVAAAPPGSRRRLLLFPLLWMASEHARSFAYGGFPWNLTAHALYRHPVWLQSASVWGVYGVGAAVMAATCLLADAAVRRGPRPLALAAILALAAGGWGVARLAVPPGPGREIRVALLQPNLSEEDRSGPAGAARSCLAVVEQARAAAKERPALIVVPESALPVYWDDSAALRRDFTEIARRGPSILFNDVESGRGGRYYNVARLLGPRGLDGAPYRKVHLVPFGEYVPLPRLFFFVRQISNQIGAFSASPEPAPIDAGTWKVGVGVCYEIVYPSLAREEVEKGANLLVTISNDSWYGRAGAQAQHFAGALPRTIETNRYLLRAAITGISGIVDERGRIRAELPRDRKGTILGSALLLHDDTLWTRWGFWIPRIDDLAAAAVLLFGLVRLRRERRTA